jgi:hypothetical protein
MPTSTFRRTRRPTLALALALAATLALGAGACSDAGAPVAPGSADAVQQAKGTPGTHRQYGVPVKLGNGSARTYVVLDEKLDAPVEVGVALDEGALQGLPAASHDHGSGSHEDFSMYVLKLPARNPTSYQFVELDWNPQGHGYPYEAPHFDFHFYRISLEERDAIDPSDPSFAERAANMPAPAEIPAGYISSHLIAGKTPAEVTVPKMGLHWLDLASPELPPQSKPFTATYILGSWDGRVIFDEPMVTREFILGRRDGAAGGAPIIPLPLAQRYAPAGYYPSGYRVSYDAQAREYRIALTGLTERN